MPKKIAAFTLKTTWSLTRFTCRHSYKAARAKPAIALVVASIGLVACSSHNSVTDTVRNTVESITPRNPFKKTPSYSPYGGTTKPSSVKIGKSYKIKGTRYQPAYDRYYSETGMASWYGPGFHGRKTANGERYDQNAMTAAHRTLPLPSMVRVTRTDNGKSIIVRVNDRGPFAHGRIIDLSKEAASRLGMIGAGVAEVHVEYLENDTRDYLTDNNITIPDYMQASTPSPKPFVSKKPQLSSRKLPSFYGGNTEPGGIERYRPTTSLSVNNEGVGVSMSFGGNDITQRRKPAPAAFKVQTAAFANEINAHAHAEQLRTIGAPTVTSIGAGEDRFYRVSLGPVTSYEQAIMLMDKTKGMGFDNARIVVD